MATHNLIARMQNHNQHYNAYRIASYIPQHQRYVNLFTLFILTTFIAFVTIPGLAFGARSAPESFADLVEDVRSAVVNITVDSSVDATNIPQYEFIPKAPENSPFRHFFDDFFDRGGSAPPPRSAIGSGFVISEDGYIVTNDHVISNANKITIEFFSGKTLQAKLIGTDPNTDIALLKVDSDEALEYVAFGDSNAARVGDWVMAVGNPLGQGFSVSVGIISAHNRSLNGAYDDFIQTDAAINRGNSGGPLFNIEGDVIGVNTSIISPSGGSVGLGFSMSSAVVTKVVDQLKAYGETRRGWLGVQIQNLTPDLQEAWALAPDITGVVVTSILEGPARKAGLKIGDVIYLYEGQKIEDSGSFVRMVSTTEIGKKINLKIYRNNKKMTISLKLGQREKFERKAMSKKPNNSNKQILELGLELTPLDEKLRQQFGLPDALDGLFVSRVAPNSLASQSKILEGSVILRANNVKMRDSADLDTQIKQALKQGRKNIALLIFINGSRAFIPLKLE